MRKSVPIQIAVYFPQTKESRTELAKQVADIHADFANYRLRQLGCPTAQKLALIDALIAAKKCELPNPKQAAPPP